MRGLFEYWRDHPPLDAVVRAFVCGEPGAAVSSEQKKGTMQDLAAMLGGGGPGATVTYLTKKR